MTDTSLLYLDFDASYDEEGGGSFDALASVGAERRAALWAEAAAVLAWAHEAFPGQRGALDEGGEWDYHLSGSEEATTPLRLDYEAGALRATPGPATAVVRVTLALTLVGTPAFCAALRERYGLD